MKTTIQKLFLVLALVAVTTLTHGATVAAYDSVISLATNVTKNYSFTDPAPPAKRRRGGHHDTHIPPPPSPRLFSCCDPGNNNNYTHLGIDGGNGGGDGNLIIYGEGANFSATLISSSSGVTASSVRFAIAGLGFRAVDGQLKSELDLVRHGNNTLCLVW